MLLSADKIYARLERIAYASSMVGRIFLGRQVRHLSWFRGYFGLFANNQSSLWGKNNGTLNGKTKNWRLDLRSLTILSLTSLFI